LAQVCPKKEPLNPANSDDLREAEVTDYHITGNVVTIRRPADIGKNARSFSHSHLMYVRMKRLGPRVRRDLGNRDAGLLRCTRRWDDARGTMGFSLSHSPSRLGGFTPWLLRGVARLFAGIAVAENGALIAGILRIIISSWVEFRLKRSSPSRRH